MLHDYDLIKEAFSSNDFNDRPALAPAALIAGPKKRGKSKSLKRIYKSYPTRRFVRLQKTGS